MHKTKAYKALLAGVMIAAVMSGCKEKADEPRIPVDAVYDFVTIVETSSRGSVFTMQRSADSPLIRYTAAYDLSKSTKLMPGERIIISYSRADGENYTDGPINLYGYSHTSNTRQDVIRGDSVEWYMQYSQNPMTLVSAWRTGPYINVLSKISVTRAHMPKTYVLVLDEKTLANDTVDLHLVYENDEGNDGVNPYDVTGSFDVGDIREQPTCKAIRLCTSQSSMVIE